MADYPLSMGKRVTSLAGVPGTELAVALFGFVATVLGSCHAGGISAPPADPRVILAAHISHGIGDSPFDSPLVHDSSAAELIVRAADCTTAARLRRLHPEDTGLLERLQSAGLLVMREGRVCTAFPLLIHERQERYAAVTAEIAEEAVTELSSDFSQITALVRQRGWSDWEYHFLWSQLFDSQFAWTTMMRRQLVPPLGHLIAWVVYPDHPFRSGTNYFPDTELRDHWLMVTWRAGGANTVGIIGGSWELVYGAALAGRALSEVERRGLAQINLVDVRGDALVPLLRDADPLLERLRSAAERYVGFLERRMPLERLVALSRTDRQHAFAMAYHDISWDILERLNRAGGLAVPAALERRAATSGSSSMVGVVTVSPVHAEFADLIRAAIQSR
jgi:hypothetical protein